MSSDPVLDLSSLKFSYEKGTPFIAIDGLTIKTGAVSYTHLTLPTIYSV